MGSRGRKYLLCWTCACNFEQHWVFWPPKIVNLPAQVLQARALLFAFPGTSQALVVSGVWPALISLFWWFWIYFPLFQENSICYIQTAAHPGMGLNPPLHALVHLPHHLSYLLLALLPSSVLFPSPSPLPCSSLLVSYTGSHFLPPSLLVPVPHTPAPHAVPCWHGTWWRIPICRCHRIH